jgi:hypothetical protein
MVYVIHVCRQLSSSSRIGMEHPDPAADPIIRSYSLYIQQWYMSYTFVDSFQAAAGSGWKVKVLENSTHHVHSKSNRD